MKTIYVPKGETVSYESVVTDTLIIHGCLNVTYGVKARHICGDGVIHAGTVSADTILAADIECSTIICEKLLARRVCAAEVFASVSAAVSCFLSAAYVETGSLTVAVSEISEVKAGEVINLKPKKRGLLRMLIASSLKAWWLSLTAPVGEKNEAVDAEFSPVQDADDSEKAENAESAALREEIAKSVREILDERDKANAKSAAGTNAEQDGAASASEQTQEDFELKRIIGLYKLARESGYTLRLVPGTPEENAPVFDFDKAEIVRPAA